VALRHVLIPPGDQPRGDKTLKESR
jgi:hypothetical protein